MTEKARVILKADLTEPTRDLNLQPKLTILLNSLYSADNITVGLLSRPVNCSIIAISRA